MAENEATVISSLCIKCEKQGETSLLLTKIPFFKDVVLASFSCPHCGYRNNEVQTISEIQDKGSRIRLSIRCQKDLNRQIVKSGHASVIIPSLEFEIPAGTQKGIASTVQGILLKASEDLNELQPLRRVEHPEIATKLQKIIDQLSTLANQEDPLPTPFDFVLDDPSGNSYIESYCVPEPDPQITEIKYDRTKEQLHEMGYYEENPDGDGNTTLVDSELKIDRGAEEVAAKEEAMYKMNEEAVIFKCPCAHCGQEGEEKMCEIDIPGFKEVILMAFTCNNCGFKNSEVKPSQAYGDHGRKWVLKVEDMKDMTRDVLLSDTASLIIPELDLKLEAGTLGSSFTSIEGILTKIRDDLKGRNPFTLGDSARTEVKEKMQNFIERLDKFISGEVLPFTLILDDMADHSHIGQRDFDLLYLKDKFKNKCFQSTQEQDPQLTHETYERSEEQNDILGISDMKV